MVQFKRFVGVLASTFMAWGPAALGIEVTAALSGTAGGGEIGMIEPLSIEPGAAYIEPGLAVLGSHKLTPEMEIESGLWYFSSGGAYHIKDIPTAVPGLFAEGSSRLKTTFLRIPIMFHYWFHPMFSAGLGVYFARGMGNIKGKNTLYAGGTKTTSDVNDSWDKYGLKQNDYGLMLDLTHQMPISGRYSFYASFKYAKGLAELAKSDNSLAAGNFFKSFKVVDMSLLLGVKAEL